ncbi:zinc ribbon domain-containing protein [Chromobacterium subtsugae]|uniref:zinc ribbon domain-containing protein n=1 Tax=Chromobacterium subtsugae TaxID=251747 RepID=UPI00069B7ECC|nr:zinc ribbon domain-containing protein [Chromobacterium subtsugae]
MQQGQALSRPEKMVRLASWLVALVFAALLAGLGELVIRDLFYLPAGGPPQQEAFRQRIGLDPLKRQQEQLQRQTEAQRAEQEKLAATRGQLERSYQTQRQGLDNWLASRAATADAGQSGEVVRRARALDALQAQILQWQQKEDQASSGLLALAQRQQTLQAQVDRLEQQAGEQYQQASDRFELKVFALRLAVILPLLLLGVWLFLRYRAHRYWFFVYGFGLFALFAFFVELLPYLPSFGGYVRFLVGIALTVFAGMRMIQAFQRYAEKKRAELQQSQGQRAGRIAYAKALLSYQKRSCPSCDHQYNIAGDDADYCIHCGLQLFRVCACGARNFAFFPFCKKCGGAVARPAALPDHPASKPE